MNSFSPEKIFKGTNSNGSKFTVEEYSLETYSNISLINGLMLFIGGIMFSIIVAPIFFILGILYYGPRFNLFFCMATLLSGYFLIDVMHGWVYLSLLDLVFNESTIALFVKINTGIFLVSLSITLLGKRLHNLIFNSHDKTHNRWVTFGIIVGLLFFIGYQYGKSSIDNKNGWVSANLKSQETPIQSSKEIEENSNKRYEDQLKKEGRRASRRNGAARTAAVYTVYSSSREKISPQNVTLYSINVEVF
jgi:apolipoprotein N-acyltransferase